MSPGGTSETYRAWWCPYSSPAGGRVSRAGPGRIGDGDGAGAGAGDAAWVVGSGMTVHLLLSSRGDRGGGRGGSRAAGVPMITRWADAIKGLAGPSGAPCT